MAAAALVILGQFIGAFVGLEASSFWVDELYTAWTIDTPTWGETWRRALADVHPPVHALAAHAWIGLFGLDEVSLRLLSTVSSLAAVAVLIIGARRELSISARLLVGAVASCSMFWIEQSQNGRMYGLGMLFGALVAVVALRIVASARNDRSISLRMHMLLGLCAFAAAFTHFYLLLAVGAIYLGLILSVVTWRDRLLLAGFGALILLVMLIFLTLLLSNTMVDIQDAWFDNSLKIFVYGTLDSAEGQLGEITLVLLGLMMLAAAPGVAAHWRDGFVREKLNALALLLFVPVGLVAAGITVSLAVAPSFSGRNIAVAAPFVWLAVGCLYDLATWRSAAILRAVVLLIGVVASAANGRTVLDRLMPQKEEFRASAAFIRGLSACAGKPIPILRGAYGDVSPLMIQVIRYEYGYYLGRAQGRPLRNPLPIGYVRDLDQFRFSPQIAGLIADRLSGRDACPVLAWAVHVGLDEPSLARDIESLGGGTKPVTIKAFPNYHSSKRDWIVGARVVLADRDGSAK